MEIHIETSSYCNANCIFCGYKNMTREKGKMDDSLFKKVIDEIGGMEKPVYLKMAHYNEFFLDKRWFDFLKYIDDNAPETTVHIPTNGSCLTYDVVDRLMSIKTFKEILFSVYSFNPKTHAEITGLPLQTLDLIKDAIKEIFEKRKDVKGWIGCSLEVLDGNEISNFLKTAHPLMKKYPQLRLAHHPIVRHKYNKEYLENRWFFFRPDSYCESPCSEPFTTMTILYNGDVCGCCFDINGEVLLGNVRNEHLIDIWNGDRLKEFRKKHTDGERKRIELCRECSQPCDIEIFKSLLVTEGVFFSKGGTPIRTGHLLENDK